MRIDQERRTAISWGCRVKRAAAGGVTSLLLSGCALHNLAFVKDDRLRIVSPSEFARVGQPITVAWAMSHFTVTGPDGHDSPDAGYFAVFVDSHPPPGGQPLAELARGDKTCIASRGCPDATYFSSRRIYVTQSTRFTVPSLPPPPLGTGSGDQIHTVTVIPLDGNGRRIGESAYASVDLRIPTQQAS
jgi:hypothetical protein